METKKPDELFKKFISGCEAVEGKVEEDNYSITCKVKGYTVSIKKDVPRVDIHPEAVKFISLDEAKDIKLREDGFTIDFGKYVGFFKKASVQVEQTEPIFKIFVGAEELIKKK